MVDKALVAAKIASVRDAVTRIRDVVPGAREAFLADRTTRELPDSAGYRFGAAL
jgi:hypothetical protein